MNLARLGLVVIQPVASFDWTHLDQEDFDETGAMSLNLSVKSETIDSIRSGAGLRAFLRYPIGDETEMVPELRARWLHEFGDRDRLLRGRLSGAPAGAGTLRVHGAETPRDSFLAGLGWSVALGERLRVHADYDAIVDSDRLDHEFGVTLRARF